ncbi:tumor protein p53-inducible protein 11-like isoform X1 [Oncorhynchus clarkii lewisi]|uniref:tumor protein p53-inducible protein 11-like isoform X1 n=1 Tax=Oncorhynchus clarkii lewisi TaxID=490388 RepID=UPI0039B927B5
MSSKPQPPLMKKHSQTDLVSRLKTRKILGVGGEDDDGEIHRSKALVFPSQLYEFVFELRTTRISIRLYGGALLSVSLIMWKGLYTAEKAIIQWTLLTEACLLSVQFLVTSITLVELGLMSNSAILLLLSEVLFLIITLLYYYHLGRRTKKTQNHTHSSD